MSTLQPVQRIGIKSCVVTSMMIYAAIGGIAFLLLTLFGGFIMVGSYISESPEQFQYKIEHGIPVYLYWFFRYLIFVFSGAIYGFFLAILYNLYWKFTRHAPLKVELIEEKKN